jgi:hypothetical protein
MCLSRSDPVRDRQGHACEKCVTAGIFTACVCKPWICTPCQTAAGGIVARGRHRRCLQHHAMAHPPTPGLYRRVSGRLHLVSQTLCPTLHYYTGVLTCIHLRAFLVAGTSSSDASVASRPVTRRCASSTRGDLPSRFAGRHSPDHHNRME